jgi:hypothetical protein
MAASESEPFGAPDGAAEDPGSFVEFDDVGRWRDLALDDKDRRARILVGRRGSGKSRYLRKMQVSVQKEGLLDFGQRSEKISLNNLRWLYRSFPDRSERLEVWEKLWSCSIYAGVASFLLNSRHRSNTETKLSTEDRDFLAEEARSYVPGGPREIPIVAVLNDIIESYKDRSRLMTYVNDPIWLTIESIILDAISIATPIFCFIDALDDNYAQAPAESTDAQLGLIFFILRKVVDPTVQNRLHIVVTVRDVIYSALLESDNGQRYNNRLHIRCLDWDDRSSSFYLKQKIGRLSSQFCIGGKQDDSPIEKWLGFDTIGNSKRNGALENVEDYILRHTRFLPREINEIGNSLSKEIRAQKSLNRPIDPEKIRRIISSTAQSFARNMVNEVTLHSAALDQMHDPKDPLAAQYIKYMNEAVTEFLAQIESEKFSKAKLENARQAFSTAAPWWAPVFNGRTVLIEDVLWQHGLIGYRRAGDPERWVRYFNSAAWAEGDLNATLPEAAHYYMHSALLDIRTLTTEQSAPIAHVN